MTATTDAHERDQAWNQLQEQAFTALLEHDIVQAQSLFNQAYNLRYGKSWAESATPAAFWTQPGPELPAAVPLAKLRHDLEQLTYLIQTDRLPDEVFGPQRDRLAAVCKDLQMQYPDAPAGQALPLRPAVREALRPLWGRNLYRDLRMPAAALLNPAIDFERLSQDYHRNAPGFALADQILSAEALHALLGFCQQATIWNDFGRGAYVGSYLRHGFCTPLILRLSQALRQALPKVLPYALTMAWSYKYDTGQPGVGLHADSEGRVNVNFWITPESANLQPESGGLILYDVLAPEDWQPHSYQHRMHELFKPGEFKAYSVPYRQNRAQFFNSQLFHQSEAFQFRPGYLNRRINVTLIFGFRRAELHEQRLYRWSTPSTPSA